jgi:hypothetical protein
MTSVRPVVCLANLSMYAIHRGCLQVTPPAPDSSSQGTPIPVERAHEIDPSYPLDEDAREVPAAALDTTHACNQPSSHSPACSPGYEGHKQTCSTQRHAGQLSTSQARVDSGPALFRAVPLMHVQTVPSAASTDSNAVKAMSPSTFQAIREIGQGAFGKVGIP